MISIMESYALFSDDFWSGIKLEARYACSYYIPRSESSSLYLWFTFRLSVLIQDEHLGFLLYDRIISCVLFQC